MQHKINVCHNHRDFITNSIIKIMFPKSNPSYDKGETSHNKGSKPLSAPNKSVTYSNHTNSSAYDPHQPYIHKIMNHGKEARYKDYSKRAALD